jgi:hypothetical protein
MFVTVSYFTFTNICGQGEQPTLVEVQHVS